MLRFTCVLYISILIFLASCSLEKNKNLIDPNDSSSYATTSTRKWEKFSSYTGIQMDFDMTNASDPNYVTDVLSKMPISADPSRYFLDERGRDTKGNKPVFYRHKKNRYLISAQKYASLSEMKKNEYETWTRYVDIIDRIKSNKNGSGVYDRAWRTQCREIVGLTPYKGHDQSGLLTQDGILKDPILKDPILKAPLLKDEANISQFYVIRFKSYEDEEMHSALISMPFKKTVEIDKNGIKESSRVLKNEVFHKAGLEHSPAIFYAHGGDSGTDIKRIIDVLGMRVFETHPVFIPLFPGENLCPFTSNSETRQCLKKEFYYKVIENYFQEIYAANGSTDLNSFLKTHLSFQDHSARESESLHQLASIEATEAPVFPNGGVKDPLDTDILEILSLNNCLNRFLSIEEKVPELDPNSFLPKRDSSNKLVLIDNPLKDEFEFHVGGAGKKIKAERGVFSILMGSSRGGGVTLGSLAHAGMLIADANDDNPTVPQKKYNTSFIPSYFSSAAIFYAPTSLFIGQFRVLVKLLTYGEPTPLLQSLPMVPELSYLFRDYRNAPEDSLEEQEALENLTADLARSDVVFMAPYVGVALQNWVTRFRAPYELQRGVQSQNAPLAPGAIAIFHALEDRVIPYSSSIIAYKAFEVIRNMVADSKSPLWGQIPGFSNNFFSFQVDEKLYNTERFSGERKEFCNEKESLDGQRCFRMDRVLDVFAHGDHAFDNALFANPIPTYEGKTKKIRNELGKDDSLFFGKVNITDFNYLTIFEQLKNSIKHRIERQVKQEENTKDYIKNSPFIVKGPSPFGWFDYTFQTTVSYYEKIKGSDSQFDQDLLKFVHYIRGVSETGDSKDVSNESYTSIPEQERSNPYIEEHIERKIHTFTSAHLTVNLDSSRVAKPLLLRPVDVLEIWLNTASLSTFVIQN